MSVPAELKTLCDKFFDANAKNFDLTENSGCGQYMEKLVPYCQTNGFPKVGHLKKSGGTMYNGHANDSFLYNEPVAPDNLLQAVDVIANAEAKPPYTPTHKAPAKGWSVDDPRYKSSDWMQSVSSAPNPNPEPEPETEPDSVPWVPYWGDEKSDELTRTLFYDFSRAKEPTNPGMGRWLNRALHSAAIGPMPPSSGGVPLGIMGAIAKHRPEWCHELSRGGVPMDPNEPVPPDYYPEWSHG